MKLQRFRVTNSRSVEDSGWIDVEDITAFIGTNESGKTNLLVPLWKLNPVRDGEINALADYPRKRYNEIRNMAKKPMFVRAQFELSDDLASNVAELTGSEVTEVKIVTVSRDFDGGYTIDFPNASPVRDLPAADVAALLSEAHKDIVGMEATSKAEEGLKERSLSSLIEGREFAEAAGEVVDEDVLCEIKKVLDGVDASKAAKRSTIAPRYGQTIDAVEEMIGAVSKLHPAYVEEARKLVHLNMPSFVYYANYGNLDSEIYLPHVIQNMKRTDLGSREEAKTRTLRVLFEFVRLSPKEILELGQDHPVAQQGEPTEDQIRAVAEKKTEREVLLQSASTDLTQKFRDWWKQGDYRLRFQADGNHFRIWISDDKRPEEIELEGRSTGLQWFLSFFLVFLVESAGEHEGSVLLLDEPGLSLHPIAQEDLSAFFENLSGTNQIMYTAHSPFMVDADHLDRVKAVFVDERGATAVSSDLRAPEGNKAQSRSIYPVHAAVGLSVSETLLYGCQPVIVEGRSDQIYLSAIKNYLIGKGRIKPGRELVFVPSGGVKGVASVTSIITGTDEELPYAVLDSDRAGRDMANRLRKNLYGGADERVHMIGDFADVADAEVEDLFPTPFLARIIARHLRGSTDAEEEFDEMVEDSASIIPQVEAYAKRHGIELELGWKVEVAKTAKTRLLGSRDPMKGQDGLLDIWEELFERLQPS
jgi:energy-coupling factor transporter ATP-binding protein EcfA2